MGKIIRILVPIVLLLFVLVSCDDQIQGYGSFEIVLHTESVADYLAANEDGVTLENLEWDLYSLVEIEKVGDGGTTDEYGDAFIDPEQTFYIGGQNGVISINNIPPGDTYRIHPLFTDESYDIEMTAVKNVTVTETIIIPEMLIYFYAINPETITDVNFRKELAQGIDREELLTDTADAAGDLRRTALYTMLPSGLLNDGLSVDTTISESTSLLTGDPVDFSLKYNTSDHHAAVAIEFVSQLNPYSGVGNITVSGKSWTEFTEDRENLEFDIIRIGWALDSNNPIAYLNFVIDSVGFTSTAYDEIETALLNAQLNAEAGLEYIGLSDFVSYTNQLHDIIIDNGLAIPLFEY